MTVIADRFTYRYQRNGQTYENHYYYQDAAIARAVIDVETLYAVPVCIKADGRAILFRDDIVELWREKYLGPEDRPISWE